MVETRRAARQWLILVISSIVAVCAQAQEAPGIDPSLFGDNLGPAIQDWPETGDEDWIVEDEPPAPPEPTPPTPADPELPDPVRPLPTAPGVEPTEPDKPEKKRRALLPWNRKKEQKTRDEEERAKNGPRLSDWKKRTSQDGEVEQVDSGLLASELHRWKRDPRKAMQEARKDRRLLLLWMTDSKRIEAGGVLAVELFRHTQFLLLAKEFMVLTRVDFGENEIASHPYAKFLKEKLNVVGFPTMILFDPDGDEVWRYTGYRPGRFSSILGDLKGEAQRFSLKERYRREKMQEKGYRFWTNYQNQPMYARAVKLSREDKMVELVDESGKRVRYPVLKLSADDRSFLSKKFPKR